MHYGGCICALPHPPTHLRGHLETFPQGPQASWVPLPHGTSVTWVCARLSCGAGPKYQGEAPNQRGDLTEKLIMTPAL